jgi:hypothetical protein
MQYLLSIPAVSGRAGLQACVSTVVITRGL